MKSELSSARPRYIIRQTGEWSRDWFGRKIAACAILDGKDVALARMMEAFPHLQIENANLWLAYLLDTEGRGKPFNPYIMDTFRQMDWYGILRIDTGQDLVVRLARYLRLILIPRQPELSRLLPQNIATEPLETPGITMDNEDVAHSDILSRPTTVSLFIPRYSLLTSSRPARD